VEDYFSEGSLIWLDADILIREKSHGSKSLDDFCKRFFGPPSGAPDVRPYSFDDLVSALNRVEPYDWASFLRDRVDAIHPHAPLGGITGSGWKLVYSDVRPDYWRLLEGKRKIFNFNYSLGLRVSGKDGEIIDVILGSPADQVGIAPATNVIAVNGLEFTPERLRDAVALAKRTTQPIDLEIREGDSHKTFRIDYHEGERFPHLVRDETRPDLLTEIIRPHAH
jgi:predicted metalloprotease with PDZ domain